MKPTITTRPIAEAESAELVANNPRDIDATDGEEPDRAEAYERRCNLQDRYNQ